MKENPVMLHVFNRSETAPIVLWEADEVALILSAQAGDESAKLQLIEAYAPILRKTVARFSSGEHNPDLDLGDLQSSALVAFLTLIKEHDATVSPRLAGRVKEYLTRFLSDEFSAIASFTVPARTLRRFYGLVKMFDGDLVAAEAAASDHHMSAETFRDVLAAVRGTDSLDGLSGDDDSSPREVEASSVFSPSPVVDVEDKILVELAFKACDDDQERITRLYYGFTDYNPQSDEEIAPRVGMSRATVQRKRVKALGEMRKAIGVTLGAEA